MPADAGALEDESPRHADVALAVALAVFAQLDLRYNLDNSTYYGSRFAAAAMVAIATLALAWRRRWPFATLCVVAAAVGVPELFTSLTITLWGHFVPLLVASYSVARWCERRVAAAGAVVAVATIVVLMLRLPVLGTAANIPFAFIPFTGAFVAGRVLRERHARHAELAARAERLEADRATQISAALEDERNRIARELHDIVAHCVSVMVVQAGMSEDLLDRSPERAREPLRAVQETGRQAVAELGRMLGLLRSGRAPDAPDLAPQPGTAQLPALAERISALGLPVKLAVVGEPVALPPGVDLTAYRIAQEALTNTLKHAGNEAKAHVELRYLARALEVEVTDDGPGWREPAGMGHGLIGMRERVTIYGGTLCAGPGPDGGFRVHVTLPLKDVR
ncbi:MAG TPA: sensor histidine kinase [Actinomycetes bacterium]|jgi:signal transduction histidine kinase